MTETLNILLVEDNENDAVLIILELRRAGLSSDWLRVQSAEDLKDALVSRVWDVVIIDFSISGFSALAALEILRQSNLDLPIIVISSTMGEEFAVAMMRGGAHDYLMKSNLRRLAETVRREVDAARIRQEHRRALQSLRLNEARLREAQRVAHLGSFEHNLQSGECHCSDEYFRILGYEPGEVSHDYEIVLQHIHPDDRQRVEEVVAAAQQESRPYEIDYRILHKDGEVRYIHAVFQMPREDDIELGNFLIGTLQDVTEKAKLEQSLRESEEMYRQLFEAESDAIMLIENTTGNILAANNAAAAMYGYSIAELLKKKNTDLSAEVQETRRITRETPLAIDQVITVPLRYHRRKDGSVFPVEITGRFFNWRGRSVHIAAIRDITERKKLEDGLRRVDRALRTLSDCNQAIIRAIDETELLKTICHILVEGMGYRLAWVGYAEEDEAKSVRPVASAGDEDNYLSEVSLSWADNDYGRGPTGTAIRTGEICIVRDIANTAVSYPWREQAVKRGYVSSIALPLLSDHRRVLGALNIYAAEVDAFNHEEVKLLAEIADDLMFGITILRAKVVREQMEASLRQSEEHFRRLVESSPDAIFVQTRKRFAYVNPVAVRLFGADSPDQLLGQPVLDRFHPNFHALVEERIHRLNVERKEVPPLQQKYVRLDGSVVDVETNAIPFTYEGENGALVFVRDITERKRLEEILTRQMEELSRYSKELERYAYVASHHLQEPLRQISGLADLLKRRYRDCLNERGNAYLGRIIDGAERLRELINGLLEYTHLERSKLTCEPTDLEAVLDGVLAGFSTRVQELGADIRRCQLPSLSVNRASIARVFEILIENALKFHGSAPPEISIDVSCQEGFWHFSVRDNGIGIDPKYHEIIFEPFQKLHPRHKYPGAGINLAICRRIVEHHGGRLWVESQAGQGATFYVTLPS